LTSFIGLTMTLPHTNVVLVECIFSICFLLSFLVTFPLVWMSRVFSCNSDYEVLIGAASHRCQYIAENTDPCPSVPKIYSYCLHLWTLFVASVVVHIAVKLGLTDDDINWIELV
jgi:hypothetical protein